MPRRKNAFEFEHVLVAMRLLPASQSFLLKGWNDDGLPPIIKTVSVFRDEAFYEMYFFVTFSLLFGAGTFAKVQVLRRRMRRNYLEYSLPLLVLVERY